jgi:hypothetical protein
MPAGGAGALTRAGSQGACEPPELAARHDRGHAFPRLLPNPLGSAGCPGAWPDYLGKPARGANPSGVRKPSRPSWLNLAAVSRSARQIRAAVSASASLPQRRPQLAPLTLGNPGILDGSWRGGLCSNLETFQKMRQTRGDATRSDFERMLCGPSLNVTRPQVSVLAAADNPAHGDSESTSSVLRECPGATIQPAVHDVLRVHG